MKVVDYTLYGVLALLALLIVFGHVLLPHSHEEGEHHVEAGTSHE